MRIYAWNVNGLRACANKGFLDWLKGSKGQIITTQEVRALPEQLPPEVRSPPRWHTHFVPAERKGYSGVGTFSRYAFDEVQTSLGRDEFDAEGRILMTRFGSLWVVNGYFPNGNGSVLPGGKRSNDRVPYKLRFYSRLLELLQPRLQAGEPVLVMGDFNTAHTEIDLARPKGNKGTSGFLPEEREALDEWMQAGWVDTFRHFHPDAQDHYTWWAQRGGCRERNVGWRIDYILASPAAVPFLKAARIHPEVMGSDHCPLSVDVDPKIKNL